MESMSREHLPNRLAEFETPEEVAEALVALRYDALRDILHGMSKALYRDAMADAEKGRHKLALCLFKTANGLQAAHEGSVEAWRICEPHMIVDEETKAP